MTRQRPQDKAKMIKTEMRRIWTQFMEHRNKKTNS